MILTTISTVLSDIPKNYLIFRQVTEDSVLSGKIHEQVSEKAKLTELKAKNLKAGHTVRLLRLKNKKFIFQESCKIRRL